MVQQSHILEPYKSILCRLIVSCSLIRHTAFPKDLLDDMHKFVVETLALAEVLLPFYLFGINFHLLVHSFAPEGAIRELGPVISHHTFDQEREGGRIAKLATSRKSPVVSIRINIYSSGTLRWHL